MEWLKHLVTKRYVDIIPGLASVIAILESISQSLEHSQSHESSVAWLFIGLCGFGIYVIGNWWDSIVFDPLFSVLDDRASRKKRMWWGLFRLFQIRRIVGWLPPTKALETARGAAGKTLNPERANQEDYLDLHQTAKRLASAQVWKDQIEPLLENSKTARTFLFPLLLLTIYRYNFPNEPSMFVKSSVLRWIWLWRWDALLFVVAVLIYLWLRVTHMTRLYNLTESNARREGDHFTATYHVPLTELPYLLPKAPPKHKGS